MRIPTILIACLGLFISHGVINAAGPKPEEVKKRLLEFSQVSTELGPYLAGVKSFEDPSQAGNIEKAISILQKLAHETSMENHPSLLVNPIVKLAFPFPEKDLELAGQLFKNPKTKPLARMLLSEELTTCMSCHTRTKKQREIIHLKRPSGFASWSDLDKAAYAASVWDFEFMIRGYEGALGDKRLKVERQEWRASLQQLLAVIARHKKNPSLVLEMISFFTDRRTVPKNLKSLVRRWAKDAESWRNEVRAPATRPDKLKALKKFISRGQIDNQKQDGAGMISFLRANILAEEILEEPNYDRVFDETLFWSALIAEATASYNVWIPANIFRESCIRHEPKSKIAQDCYVGLKKYYAMIADRMPEKKLPSLLESRLQKLTQLAQPKK